MYITNRFWLKYGMETDPMEVTTKERELLPLNLKVLKELRNYSLE